MDRCSALRSATLSAVARLEQAEHLQHHYDHDNDSDNIKNVSSHVLRAYQPLPPLARCFANRFRARLATAVLQRFVRRSPVTRSASVACVVAPQRSLAIRDWAPRSTAVVAGAAEQAANLRTPHSDLNPEFLSARG